MLCTLSRYWRPCDKSQLSGSTKSLAHSNRDERRLVNPLFSATCGLRSDSAGAVSCVGRRLSSIGPYFAAVFSRFRAVLGIALGNVHPCTLGVAVAILPRT